ncbi:MAG TPA: hypothetical protein VF662_00935 [Allosphingosinicella sp.]
MEKQIRRFASCLLLLALSACDQRQEEQGPPPPASISEYKQRIDRLAPQQRDAVFIRAIRDAGMDCQKVVGSGSSGLQFGMPSWVARCDDGRDWMIMLDKGGRAHVARREEKKG